MAALSLKALLPRGWMRVRYRSPHQTRSTYASMVLSAGEHPMWVANQMGHSNWTMIARACGRAGDGRSPQL